MVMTNIQAKKKKKLWKEKARFFWVFKVLGDHLLKDAALEKSENNFNYGHHRHGSYLAGSSGSSPYKALPCH